MKLYSKLNEFIASLSVNSISPERREILDGLVGAIREMQEEQKPIRINFVCTHNSRRSHLAQVWAQTMSAFFQVDDVHCYSAGTEATALFPTVVETLKQTGFQIDKLSKEENPIYAIKFGENELPMIGFSKTLQDSFNPTSEFLAVMTCSHADENCPFIGGATKRIPITYEDPKIADGTPQQGEKYLERSRQIATEMKYVFEKVGQ